ncbi:MAG TPA: hypothetical protein VF790_14020 [Dissulfurispiraceae bacterium]
MISNKDRKREARRLFKKPAGPLEPVNLQECRYVPEWLTRAYKNNRVVVMIDDNAMTTNGRAIRCMVQRHDDEPLQNHWKTLQDIKNEIFGRAVVAIEYYPAESNLMDAHNIYWLWVFPEGQLPIPILERDNL